jgi:hypothetical protein
MMTEDKIYHANDGKGYMKITYTDVKIPPPPKTLDEAIQRVKDMSEFEEDKTQMNEMIKVLKENWKDDER